MPLSRNPSTPEPMNAQYPDHPSASLMPNMTEEEFQALKADIKQHGLREPILIFNGQVVDGRHRLQACRELGIEPLVKNLTCPEHDLPGLVRSLNFHRRHLTREQKQAIIRQQFKDTPDKSDRQIANDLGVSDKTVGSARKALESTAEIPQFDRTVGADGKARKRPAKPAPESTRRESKNGAKEQAQQQEEQNTPARRLTQKVSAATDDLWRAHRSLDSLLAEIYEQKITADQLNSVAFINSVAAIRSGLGELYRHGIGQQRALDQSPAASWDIPPTVDECVQQLMQNLPIPDRDDVKTALDTLIAQLKQDFQEHVEQEVVRRQREIRKQMKELMSHESLKRTERLNATMNKIAGKPVPYLTDEQFKLIRGCLHPDRHPAEEQDRYNRVFHLFCGIEDTVVLKPDTAQAMDWAKAMGL